jgi:hydrogenase nickel incorporation protein HypA/HybF
MHEYSIVQAMFDQVEKLRLDHHADAVRRIRVTIGEFAGVDPTLFHSAYEVYKIDTPCANAQLEIERVAQSDALLLDQIELEVR